MVEIMCKKVVLNMITVTLDAFVLHSACHAQNAEQYAEKKYRSENLRVQCKKENHSNK